MKIKAIKKIRRYKSFRDFSWDDFFNNQYFSDKVNLFLGENGSGKSSICNILKSVSGHQDFIKYQPEETVLAIDANEFTFTNGTWNNTISKGSLLFFDKEFVDKNVHVAHARGKHQGQQEQESGKLVIEFDSDAISLRKARDKSQESREALVTKLQEFKKKNQADLGFELSDSELEIYKALAEKNPGELSDLLKKWREKKPDVESGIARDKKLLEKVERIQADINILPTIDAEIEFASEDVYREIFDFEIAKKGRISAQESLIKKIKEYKEFFETGFEIRKEFPSECPFCQTKNEEDKIREVIVSFEQIYDEGYKKQLQEFSSKKQRMINEIDAIRRLVDGIETRDLFLELRRLEKNYSIGEIYLVEEERKFAKPQVKSLIELKRRIEALDGSGAEFVVDVYESSRKEIAELGKFINNLNGLISEKNKIISKFKQENTGEKIQERLSNSQITIGNLNARISFLENNKLEKQKKKQSALEEYSGIEKEFTAADEEFKEKRKQYEEYCSTQAFKNLLNQIQSYFKNFNFDFKLELDTTRRTGSTKEFPFAFQVLDKAGNTRDFKEGLSEGEWQVLSLCFFFAFLDIQNDKGNKILIFDDPITSLDNSNLSCLVELIGEVHEKFSQTIILTHHKTFFGFLCKKFKPRKKSDNCFAEFNILRNKDEFGGGFICRSESKKFIEKLRNFENHLQNIPPEAIDVELKTIEFGQYLRYEIERFIKNDLLHWNAHDFPAAITGVKNSKKISDEDLDRIRKIYTFCNWTTSHVDVGDDHGLSQLKSNISKFIEILDSVAD